jgi:transcriptional regulator with XRE-family HTH domain
MKGRALLAWNLRRLRSEREISQERLAADAEVDRAYVSELERKRGNPTVDLLDKLAATLQVPLSEFFREPEVGAKRPKPLRSGRPVRARLRRPSV